jgi:hypothetical protein
MPATEVTPAQPARPRAAAIDLTTLRAHVARRGEPLDEAAARYLGHAVASALAEAHAALDDEGNVAPAIHGRLGPLHVRIDVDGAVEVLPGGSGDEITAPELLAGARITPRADVHGLGTMLGPLFAASPDQDLLAALATAAEPLAARRRITCVELEAWLARGADLDAGRRALGEAARGCLDARLLADAAVPSSRPLSAPARVGVALFTAAAVFAAGVAVAERWPVR